MRKAKFLFLSVLILATVTCSNVINCDTNKLEEMKKLYSIPLKENGVLSYQHLVLIEDLEKICADSSFIMQAVDKYIAGLNVEKPVASIEIFNSSKGFDFGETLSQPKDIYKNCIVTIWFDITSGKPYKYYFYDNNGDEVYEGPLWKQ